MLLSVNESNGILYSTGMDMSLRSWTLDTMGAVGVVEVCSGCGLIYVVGVV